MSTCLDCFFIIPGEIELPAKSSGTCNSSSINDNVKYGSRDLFS